LKFRVFGNLACANFGTRLACYHSKNKKERLKR